MLACELIVITDDRTRFALPRVVADLSVRIIDWQNTDGLSSVGSTPLFIDVDLRDASKVKFIKDRLSDRVDDQCRIIAVDRGSRLSVAQANGLGASTLLKRPLEIRALTACLRHQLASAQARHGAPSESVVSVDEALKAEPGGTSILSAAHALDHMFEALHSGGRLELASVMESGEQIIGASAEVGLAKWLDTVRNYHESTFQHCLIVTGILTAFGQKNGMRRSDILSLTTAGLLHDVGKARIPIEILDKPGKLTDEEFTVIKQHPSLGYDYLSAQSQIDSQTLRAVRHHHEYLDGSGYPDGLKAQQIDDLTRIVTVCDIYGALVERRAYKAPKSPEAALDILSEMAKGGKVERSLVKALRYSVSG